MFRHTTQLFDEEMIKRLIRRQQQDEREHSRTRHLPSRFRNMYPLDGHGHEMTSPFGPRPDVG